jgi:hypothetical protein
MAITVQLYTCAGENLFLAAVRDLHQQECCGLNALTSVRPCGLLVDGQPDYRALVVWGSLLSTTDLLHRRVHAGRVWTPRRADGTVLLHATRRDEQCLLR